MVTELELAFLVKQEMFELERVTKLEFFFYF